MISLIPSSTPPSHLAKGHLLDRRSLGDGRCSMKISEDVHQYAAEQGIAEEEALAKGMEDKSKEFAEAGAQVYTKA
jgi:hypothetical protein